MAVEQSFFMFFLDMFFFVNRTNRREHDAIISKCLETTNYIVVFWKDGFGGIELTFFIHTVDGTHPSNQLSLAVSLIIYRVLYIPGG